jgi:hypothetical protein
MCAAHHKRRALFIGIVFLPQTRLLLASMYRSNFASLPSRQPESDSDADSVCTEDAHSFLESGATLVPVVSAGSKNWSIVRDTAYIFITGPTKSWHTSSRTPRLLSLILHSTLIAMHLALLGIWARGLEHRLTVAQRNQTIVSFLITAIMAAFGSVCISCLNSDGSTESCSRYIQRYWCS